MMIEIGEEDMIKKMIANAAAVMMMAAMLLTGCTKKMTVSAYAPELGECELAAIPEGVDSCALNNGIVTVTLKKEGDYDIVLKGDDDKEHTITIKYHDGAVEGSTDEELTLYVGEGDGSNFADVSLEDVSTEAETTEAAETEAEVTETATQAPATETETQAQ